MVEQNRIWFDSLSLNFGVGRDHMHLIYVVLRYVCRSFAKQ